MDKDQFTLMDALNDDLNVKESSKEVATTTTKELSPAEKRAQETDAKNAADDYEYARKKLKNMVDAGEEAIDHFKDVCEETREPRAYEVLATLIKATADNAKSVMDNAKTKSAVDKERGVINRIDESPGFTQNNNIIFAGSTKDLLEMVQKEQENIIEASVVVEEDEEQEENKDG